MTTKEQTHFVVTYKDAKESKVLTLKARHIRDSSLGPAFVELSDFLFEGSGLILNPSDEEVKEHFQDVRRLHLSIYHIITIEEVGKTNRGMKLKKEKSNVVMLPPQ